MEYAMSGIDTVMVPTTKGARNAAIPSGINIP